MKDGAKGEKKKPENLSPAESSAYDKSYKKALQTFANNASKAHTVAMHAVSAVRSKKRAEFTVTTKIQKTMPEEQIVFGWSYVSVNKDAAEVVDHSGESMDIEEVEKAAYGFNLLEKRSAGEMHVESGVGDLVESMVFTKEKYQALGVDPEGRPLGWWVGFHVADDKLWKSIKDGTYTMFSIEGTAIREAIDDAAA